jgi:zinc protease
MLAALALLALAGARPSPAIAQATAAATAGALQVTPPMLAIQQHELANGLKVLFYEDHSVPVLNLQIIYHVGSKNEPPGRSGFAHLFEHIMFKGSENVDSEEHKVYVESIGGAYNAGTDFDTTTYWETIPSNYLERFLWLEADRMRALNVNQENFVSERDVVKEEKQLRYDTPPFGRLLEYMLSNTYKVHPYKVPAIGKVEDLNAAKLEDVQAFHSRFYVPNNATMIISGDFNPAQAMQWIEKYFGPVPKGQPISRDIPQEPAQNGERRATVYDNHTPLPLAMITFHIPKAGDPDNYALEVAGNILSQGESSRIYRDMVYEKQMALAAGGQSLVLEDPGVFFFYAILQAGHTAEEGEKALLDQVQQLQAQPVSEEELEKAKNQIISGLVFGRETVQQKADAIGYAAVILGDLSMVNQQLPLYQKVTAADVQRVAQKYFRPDNRTVVYMLPEASRPAAGNAPGAESGKNEVKQ